jgi:carbonic anhydrase
MFKFVAPLLVAATLAAEGVYDYMDNGATWGEGVCQTGVEQSPIDFSTVSTIYNLSANVAGIEAANSLSIGLVGPARGKLPSGAVKLDLGAGVPNGSMLLKRSGVEDSLWYPAQLHWHTPSEHTLNGASFPAEMHIVHLAKDGERDGVTYTTETDAFGYAAVYGVWFELLDCEALEGDDEASIACFEKRAASDAFFAAMSVFAEDYDKVDSFTESVSDVPVQAFVDSLNHGQFYSYNGGLTTPPCTEGVKWTML